MFDRRGRTMLVRWMMLIAGLCLPLRQSLAQPPAEAWSMQGHDAQRTGRSTVSGPRALWLKWTYDLGTGTLGPIRAQDNNSPVVAPDGTIIVPTYMDGLYAVTPDGSFLWKRPYTGSTHPHAPALSPDGTAVYYLDNDGSGHYLRAASVATGTVNWSLPLLSWTGHASYSSLAVDAIGTVYFANMGDPSVTGHLWAVNQSGTVAWSWTSTYGSTIGIEAPVAVDASGNVFVSHNVAGIVAVNNLGGFRWNYPHIGDYGWPTPTVGQDGTVYFAGDHDGDAVTRACTALNTDGTAKWTRQDIGGPGWFAGMAISADDSTVYTARSGGKLYALNAQTGATLWSSTVASNGDEFGGSPILAANNTIYLMGTDGTVYAADSTNGSFLWSYQVNSGAFYWGPPSPALGPDGTLYVLAPGNPPAFGGLPARLYAFGEPPAPAVTLSPSSLKFPTQVIGTTSRGQKVTLSNTGTAALTISSIAASGRFGQTNTCGSSVAAGANCTITVYFKPNAKGAATGAVTITDNAAGSPHTVSLSGTGTVVSLSPASLNFGSVPVGGASTPSTVTLTNKGATPLTITALAVAWTNPADFTRTHSCPISPATLGAGLSCTINVTFRPKATGTRQAVLAAVDDGGGSPQLVLLTGTGT